MYNFLRNHSGEVINMLTAEFDINKYGDSRQKSGEKKGKKEIALNAIKEKMPLKAIAKITGLSIEELKELKKLNEKTDD